MSMTDSEKITLIDHMIVDFWEFNNDDQIKEGAMHLLTAISSVLNFQVRKE